MIAANELLELYTTTTRVLADVTRTLPSLLTLFGLWLSTEG